MLYKKVLTFESGCNPSVNIQMEANEQYFAVYYYADPKPGQNN